MVLPFFILAFVACGTKEKDQTIEKSKPITVKEEPLKTKWESGYSKRKEGEEKGWIMTPDSIWIDTMRNEEHKYNSYPPHVNNKTYYPNFTVTFPSQMESPINVQEFFDIYVKGLDQSFVKNVNPIKDSQNESIRTLGILKINELSRRYLSGFAVSSEPKDQESNTKREPNRGSFAFDLKQYGDVFISQISFSQSEDFTDIQTEVIIYDNKGELIFQNTRTNSISTINVSKNKNFLFESGGGAITEDFSSAHFTTIYNLTNGEIYWNKSSNVDCITSGIVRGTNMAMINIQKECDHKREDNEAYAFDLEKMSIYKFSSTDKIRISKIRISDQLDFYYNSKTGRQALSLENDFKQIPSLP